MNKENDLHPFLQPFIEEMLKFYRAELEQGRDVSPGVVLFAKVGVNYEYFPLPEGERYFENPRLNRALPSAISEYYFNLEKQHKVKKIPFELIAVISFADVYIEDPEEAGILPNGRRLAPFTPKPGQPEALRADVHTSSQTCGFQWDYVREGDKIIFGNEDMEPKTTIHIPGSTRLGGLWPAHP